MPNANDPGVIQAAATLVAAKIAARATSNGPQMEYSEITAELVEAIEAVLESMKRSTRPGKVTVSELRT